MKEDVKNYSLFVEGAALLAWDVAWLCKTQGLDSVNAFEDFCLIGRNLWHLLTTQHRKQMRPPLDRRLTIASGKDESPRVVDPTSRLGLYSHASVRLNLTSAEGSDILRDWRLSNPARLIDKLKSILLSEISGAEWDLLEEAEWAEERAVVEPSVTHGLNVLRIAPSTAIHDNTDTDSAVERKRKSGGGWMKIRGRTGDS
jgi:hypothetical protein